jgi:hypothetical protein
MGKPSRRASRRNRVRPERRRTAAPRLEVCIVTSPGSDDSAYSLKRDIDLVRGSLLYADHIELVSMRTVMIGSFLQFGVATESDIIEMIASFDDQTLAYMNGWNELDPAFRETMASLATIMRLPAGLDANVDAAADLAREGLAPSMAEFKAKSEEMFEESGLGEILPAFQAGIVELSRSGLTDDGDTDRGVENWVELVKERLRDPTKRLLLDEAVADLVESMINEGHVELPRLTAHHAGEASIGTGLVSRLPAFPQAPTDELLDLRNDLREPLVRYRAEVARMARDASNPMASGLTKRADIDQLWLERVEPALADLREGFAGHSLIREIARTVG